MPERYKQAAKGDSNPEYTQFVEAKLIEGLRLAREKLQPARLGFGLGFSTANINRRGKDVDGKVSLGLNPDGPVDRQIGLIRIENLNGGLIGLIANYAIHGTVLGPPNHAISGDAPGVAAQYVEEKLGVPMLFINGAEETWRRSTAFTPIPFQAIWVSFDFCLAIVSFKPISVSSK